MGEYLLISDAAKQVKVESHVLRYWEEELHLPIKKKRAGAPLLYEGRRGTVQRDQEHERKGITVESN